MMGFCGGRKRDAVADAATIGGLVGVQFVYAGNSVLAGYLLSLGLNPLSLVVFTSFAAFLVLVFPSFLFERNKWPATCSSMLVLRLVLMAFGGVTLFQTLYLEGIKQTSPAMATAMPNLSPGLIFIIAWIFRLERVKLGCLYSKMKIIGTLLCMAGAIAMSLLQDVMQGKDSDEGDSAPVFKEKIVGCSYLLAAVFVLSSTIILQATILTEFPAPMSLCGITSLAGAVMTASVGLVGGRKLCYGLEYVSVGILIGYSLLGGLLSGICVSFNGWVLKTKGPVLVSIFSPISTVSSIVLSSFTWGERVTTGSMSGMMVMFAGLYLVMWAKRKEGFLADDFHHLENADNDVERPLLS